MPELNDLKNQLDEALKAHVATNKDLVNQYNKLDGKIDDSIKAANARVDESVQGLKDVVSKLKDKIKIIGDGHGSHVAPSIQPRSMGEAVISSKAFSPNFKNGRVELEIDTYGASPAVEIDNVGEASKAFFGEVAIATKSVVDLSALFTAGVLLPEYLPSVDKTIHNEFRISSIFSQGSFSKSNLSWIEYEGHSPVASLITADVPALATTVTLESVAGLSPSFKILLIGGGNRESFKIVSINALTKTITLDAAVVNPYTVASASVVQAGRTSKFGNVIRYAGISGIKPGEQKPFGHFAAIRKSADAITLATMMQMRTQDMDDYPLLVSEINKMQLQSFPDIVDQQCVLGNGVAQLELAGMAGFNKLDSFSQGGGETVPDAIRMGIARQRDIGSRSLRLIANDFDIAASELLKDSTGQYLRVVMDGKIWNVPFNTSSDVDEKQMFLGDFKRAGTLRKRSSVKFIRSFENRDNVEKNEVTFRHEQDHMLQWERPEMVSKITLL